MHRANAINTLLKRALAADLRKRDHPIVSPSITQDRSHRPCRINNRRNDSVDERRNCADNWSGTVAFAAGPSQLNLKGTIRLIRGARKTVDQSRTTSQEKSAIRHADKEKSDKLARY